VVRTQVGEQRAKQTVQRQLERSQARWKQQLWHLGNQCFVCEADARGAVEREAKALPAWFDLESSIVGQPRYTTKGRSRKDSAPDTLSATLQVSQERIEPDVRRRACFIVATIVLDLTELSDEELVTTYQG
jgi:hypothetical protein